MTASERLQALEEATIFDVNLRSEDDEWRIQKLGEVLPKIVSLVHAVEADQGITSPENVVDVHSALTALAQKLDEVLG